MNGTLRAAAQELEQESLELLTTLAQIPAPSNQEEKRALFCRDWLEACGAKGVRIDSALNVVFEYGVTPELPVVVFASHTDVVFPDTGPLPFHEDDERMYCPGIGDDTANLVHLLLAARHLVRNGIRPAGCGLLFVCNAGEEGLGNLKGTRRICGDYAGRIREFISFDGNMDSLVDRAVGSSRFEVSIRTQGGHSYEHFGSASAIAKLSALIHDIYRLAPGPHGKTTYNVGTVSGGTSVNSIAQQASMLCEYRSDSVDGLEHMKREFRRLFELHGAEAVIVGERPCENLGEAAQLRRDAMLSDAQNRVESLSGAAVRRKSGSTDCNWPLSLGIPSICMGTVTGHGAHTREESVERASMTTGCEICLDTVLQYCRTEITKPAS